jgi:ERCC4-type nuclease
VARRKKALPMFIRDTREHEGHGFRWNKCKSWDGMEVATLKYGDYSIKGYEETYVVERKGSANELINNMLTKDKERFHRELEVLANFKAACIVCEFDMKDFKKAFYVIPKRSRKYFTMEKTIGAIISIYCKYKIPIFFASNNELAKKVAQKFLLKSIKYIK